VVQAYSAKLLAGTKHRLSGLIHIRQCGDDVLRIFVTGAPPARGLDDPRVSVRPVVAASGDQPHAVAVALQPQPGSRRISLHGASPGRRGALVPVVGMQNSNALNTRALR
jgi:hypothetical protein